MDREIYAIKGEMPEMFSNARNPQMPHVNVEHWIEKLREDFHLVAHFTPQKRRHIIQVAGWMLGSYKDEYFQSATKTKSYKRSILSVQKARLKIAHHGQNWFYFGMSHPISWKTMIEYYVEYFTHQLKIMTNELVWAVKMKGIPFIPCQKCQTTMVSYISCIVKFDEQQLDYCIICKCCNGHDR
jgi:hypothetical protein